MAKSKYHYYVLVFSSDGPVYVTSIDNANKYAHWDKSKAPLEFSASYAEDLVMGLNMRKEAEKQNKLRIRKDYLRIEKII